MYLATIKESVVKPINKKGSIKFCIQYRPITLVSVWSKIIEKGNIKSTQNKFYFLRAICPEVVK